MMFGQLMQATPDMPASLTPLFVFIGAFYVFAGVVASRAVQSEAILDAAIVAIGSIGGKKRDPLDVERALWMLSGACVVGASGLLLIIGSPLAPPMFLLSCALQATHFLVLSPRRYDVEYPVEAKDRQRSLNAFTLYSIVTGFVWWASLTGRLQPIFAPSPLPLIIVSAIWVAASTKAFHWLLTLEDKRKPTRNFGSGFDEEDVPLTPEEQARFEADKAAMRAWAADVEVIFAPSSQQYSLFDAATRRAVDFYESEVLGLSAQNQIDLLAFTDTNYNRFDHEDPLHTRILDPADAQAMLSEARLLFAKVKADLGDKVRFQEEPWENRPFVHPDEIHFVYAHFSGGLFPNPDNPSHETELRPFRLGVSRQLMWDFETWSYSFFSRTEADDVIEGQSSKPWTKEERDAHDAEARALCARLVGELHATGRGEVKVFFHPPEDNGGGPVELIAPVAPS